MKTILGFIYLFIIGACNPAFALNTYPPFKIQHAIEVIQATYGDVVKIKPKTLSKYGRNLDVDTAAQECVCTMPGSETVYTQPTTNSITTISSSSSSDTIEIYIEGHKLVNGKLVFISQTATLDGQNKVTLTTPMARATRIRNFTATDLVGSISIYEDTAITNGVPDDSSKVKLVTETGSNNSYLSTTAISATDYWIVTSITLGIRRSTSANVDFELQIREVGKSWYSIFQLPVASAGTTSVTHEFDPVLIIPKNHDIRVLAETSINNTAVSARIEGYLAKVQ